MMNSFKEAVDISDEVGVKKASEQLGVSYHTLASWRQKRKLHGAQAYVGSGRSRVDPPRGREQELEREISELRRANKILKDALGFFAKDRKK